MVLAEKVQSATRYTVVVDASLIRTVGDGTTLFPPATLPNGIRFAVNVPRVLGKVALVVDIPTLILEVVAEPPGLNLATPDIS